MGERQSSPRFASMPGQKTRGYWLYLLAGLLVGGFSLISVLAASLTQRSEMRDYRVYGKTASELVNYMRRRPFRGDNDPTMANRWSKYHRTMVADAKGKSGRMQRVHLDIWFVTTLPRAVNPARLPEPAGPGSHFTLLPNAMKRYIAVFMSNAPVGSFLKCAIYKETVDAVCSSDKSGRC